MSRTKVDLGDRRTYLGGSTIAAILGLSSYQAPIDVFRFMRGLSDGQEETQRMRLGQKLEQVIADEYEEQTGRRLQRPAGGAYVHPDYPFIVGHPDRIVIGEPGIFEAKASAHPVGYGEPGTDQIPPGHRVQVEVYMGLSRREWTELVLLPATDQLRIYRVEHDPELYRSVIQYAVEWYERHVVAGEEPEPDGTEAYRRHLSERFTRDVEIEMVATPEQSLLIDELASARSMRIAAEKREFELGNRVAASMGEATLLLSPYGRCTFKPGSVVPRWKEIAEEIANEAMVDPTPFIERDRAGRTAKPTFRFWPAKQMEEAA